MNGHKNKQVSTQSYLGLSGGFFFVFLRGIWQRACSNLLALVFCSASRGPVVGGGEWGTGCNTSLKGTDCTFLSG